MSVEKKEKDREREGEGRGEKSRTLVTELSLKAKPFDDGARIAIKYMHTYAHEETHAES